MLKAEVKELDGKFPNPTLIDQFFYIVQGRPARRKSEAVWVEHKIPGIRETHKTLYEQ